MLGTLVKNNASVSMLTQGTLVSSTSRKHLPLEVSIIV